MLLLLRSGKYIASSQMIKQQPTTERNKIEKTIEELLEFRHVFNNIYGEESIYEQTERNAKQIGELFSSLSVELDAFVVYLKEPEND